MHLIPLSCEISIIMVWIVLKTVDDGCQSKTVRISSPLWRRSSNSPRQVLRDCWFQLYNAIKLPSAEVRPYTKHSLCITRYNRHSFGTLIESIQNQRPIRRSSWCSCCFENVLHWFSRLLAVTNTAFGQGLGIRRAVDLSYKRHAHEMNDSNPVTLAGGDRLHS